LVGDAATLKTALTEGKGAMGMGISELAAALANDLEQYE